jgi:predicted Fe-S protein YdhL (DUF1289 family)
MVESPCKNICIIENEVCTGCKRTRDEIRKWLKYSDEEKQKVVEACIIRQSASNDDYDRYA